ncbi:hypothetical protein BCR34DRAFT_570047 [Clohesyomyces aquaticus]|uniref:Uncharacterized protein n=1 Tax=Clohesyomyces aquaticus TaxID=1231657 RepID=A0A1Y1ZEE1_9PLEO|nr:hypothetical protein BCR34DRAFT_570047 [Clohesyomyces aquaticus]
MIAFQLTGLLLPLRVRRNIPLNLLPHLLNYLLQSLCLLFLLPLLRLDKLSHNLGQSISTLLYYLIFLLVVIFAVGAYVGGVHGLVRGACAGRPTASHLCGVAFRGWSFLPLDAGARAG